VFHSPFVPASEIKVNDDVDAVASHTQDDVLVTSHVESRFQGPLGVDLRGEESPDAVGLVITVLCTKLNAPDPSRHRHQHQAPRGLLAQLREDQLHIGDDEFN
jgi:hypothetical protein